MRTEQTAKIGRPRRKRVTFTFEAAQDSDVRLAGTFNNWDVETHRLVPKKKGSGAHSITILLPPGRHEYKFVVDGEWMADPAAARFAPNEHGTLNSVIEI